MASPPPLQTSREYVPSPATRNGEPYSQDMRDLVKGLINKRHFTLSLYREIKRSGINLPSYRTIKRWQKEWRERGHNRAYRRSGGSRFGPRLHGKNLIYLALYRLAYPKASHAEINAMLYRMNYGNPDFQFFSHSMICRAEKRLGLTRKRGSTTAYQALLPKNLLLRFNYFNLPYPQGVADIEARLQVDLDECGWEVSVANRTCGLSYRGNRVREEGPYVKECKNNLLCGICGEEGTDGAPSRRWAETWQNGGTTVERYLAFVNRILDDLGPGVEGKQYCFTMDNLRSHQSAAVAAAIHARGHRLAFRAPYYPIDGPIEYVFNTLQHEMTQRMPHIESETDFLRELHKALRLQKNFQPYFRRCGFWR